MVIRERGQNEISIDLHTIYVRARAQTDLFTLLRRNLIDHTSERTLGGSWRFGVNHFVTNLPLL